MPTSILLCDDCGEHEATWVFNNDRVKCEGCHEEHFFNEGRIETQDDLCWPLTTKIAA